jgi:predicted house-cleaning noncanonical NTP pyrophosphatase (MazG superfamily)
LEVSEDFESSKLENQLQEAHLDDSVEIKEDLFVCSANEEEEITEISQDKKLEKIRTMLEYVELSKDFSSHNEMLFLSSALKSLYTQLYNNSYLKKYFITPIDKLKKLKGSVVERDFKVFTQISGSVL